MILQFNEFNDYLDYYFSENELNDVEREIVEDCFYRQQKVINEYRKLAESFYNWTLINYPENTKEYQEDVSKLEFMLNKDLR